jgi:hypothetical protein
MNVADPDQPVGEPPTACNHSSDHDTVASSAEVQQTARLLGYRHVGLLFA